MIPPFELAAAGHDAALDEIIVKLLLGDKGDRPAIRRLQVSSTTSVRVVDVSSMSWMVGAVKGEHQHLVYAALRQALAVDVIKAAPSELQLAGFENCVINFDVPVRNWAMRVEMICGFSQATGQLAGFAIKGGDLAIGAPPIKKGRPPDAFPGNLPGWSTSEMKGLADGLVTKAPVREADLHPFLALEHVNPDLFKRGREQIVPKRLSGITERNTYTVPRGLFKVVDTSRDSKRLGTVGVGSAIAICAAGLNTQGQDILGLYHYDGRRNAGEAMEQFEIELLAAGAQAESIRYRLAGGMVAAAGDGTSSDEQLAALLALRDTARGPSRAAGTYAIESVRVPLSVGKSDQNGRLNQVNLMVGALGIGYCVDPNAPQVDERE